MPSAEVHVNLLLWKAIHERRLLRLTYKGRERVVEPHDYGVHNGVAKLFAYQVGGSSSHKLPAWRWMEEELISNIQLLDRRFRGSRPSVSGRHHKWDKLFIRAQPADEERKSL